MSWFLRSYKGVNILSLDVVAGAIISSLFFARIFGVAIRPAAFACLGISVWIIYTADHLYDARRTPGPASTGRHRFHQQHFTLLSGCIVLALVVNLVLCTFIRINVLKWGMLLVAVVMVYLVLQSSLKLLKEPAGALLYSAGVLLPSVALTDKPISPLLASLVLQFVITTLINLVLFSWFDQERDLRDHRSSIITILGRRTGRLLLIGLFLLQAMMTLINAALAPTLVVVVLALMNSLLLIIFACSRYFSVDDRWRYAGDSIFFLPLLCLAGTSL